MLINFLKEEGILMVFFINMIVEGKYSTFAQLGKAMLYKHPGFFIEEAFDWFNTKEKWGYWQAVEDRWYSYYLKHRYHVILLPQPGKPYKSFSPLHTEFISFLRAKGALPAYNVNRAKTRHSFYHDLMDKISPHHWVDRAFPWSSSKEGYDYWRRIALDWRAYLVGRSGSNEGVKAKVPQAAHKKPVNV